MCWRKERLFPKEIENLKAIIANKDIIVYKIGYKCRDNFISLYMTYEYIPRISRTYYNSSTRS